MMLQKIKKAVGIDLTDITILRSAIVLFLVKSKLYSGVRIDRQGDFVQPPRHDPFLDAATVEHDAVPALIFQTWKSRSTFPNNYAYWRSTIYDVNPNCKFVIWDDADNRNFIIRCFPWFLSQYDGMPAEIYRADAIRPFFLLYFGGIYVDMDVESINPADLTDDVVLGAMGTDLHFPHAIPNATMASKPRQIFWLLFIHIMTVKIAECRSRGSYPDPEFVTGPIILKTTYELYQSFSNEDLLEFIEPTRSLLDENLKQSIRHGTAVLREKSQFFPIDWNNPIQRRLRHALSTRKVILGRRMSKFISPSSIFITYWTHSW